MYDYKYRNRRRGPSLPLNRVHTSDILSGVFMPVFWTVLIIILFSLLGYAGLEKP